MNDHGELLAEADKYVTAYPANYDLEKRLAAALRAEQLEKRAALEASRHWAEKVDVEEQRADRYRELAETYRLAAREQLARAEAAEQHMYVLNGEVLKIREQEREAQQRAEQLEKERDSYRGWVSGHPFERQQPAIDWICPKCDSADCGRQCGDCGNRPCEHDDACPMSQ